MGAPKPRTAKAIRDALDAIDRAIEAIDAEADPQYAYNEATKFQENLRDIAGNAVSELRARKAWRIWRTDDLSLAGLAGRISVSRARADQLLKLARNAQAKSDLS